MQMVITNKPYCD